jgi:hypothetical protein
MGAAGQLGALPHPNIETMPNDGDLVDLLPLYASDPAHRQTLLVDNPQRLFRYLTWDT